MGAGGRRIPSWEDLTAPSACDACGARIRPLGLAPLLGFLLRCRACGARAPWLWPALEWSAAWAAAGCCLLGGPLAGLSACLAGLLLSLFAACDRAGAYAPSALSWPAACMGALLSPAAVAHGPAWAALGGLAMWGAAAAARGISRRRGAPFGGGDVALSAAAGSWGGALAGPLSVAALALPVRLLSGPRGEVRLGVPLAVSALAFLPLAAVLGPSW